MTLAPQIERAGFELERRFGIPENGAAEVMDPRDIREAVTLWVLHHQYLALSRDVAGACQDVFGAKAVAFKAELDDLLARLVARRRDGGVPATRFSTRLSR